MRFTASPGTKPNSRPDASSNVADDGANVESTAVSHFEEDRGSAGQGVTALKSSEDRFRAMRDALPLGILATDAQGRCIYTNPAYRMISGLTSEQALGMNWVMVIHPDDLQRVLVEWHDFAPGTASFHTEFRFLRSDGGAIWTRVNIAALYDGPDNGTKAHGHVLTFEHIGARKAADLALREAEAALFEEKERAQVTLNSIGDAVLATDIMGNVTYMSLMAEEATGWLCEEALGQPLPEVFNIIDGVTRQVAADPARRAIAEGQDRRAGHRLHADPPRRARVSDRGFRCAHP